MNDEPEPTEPDYTGRFISAAGFGFGLGLSLVVMALAWSVASYLVQAECQFRQTGPLIWMPEN